MKWQIKRMSQCDNSIQIQVATVFVDGFYQHLSLFGQNRLKLIQGLQHIFVPETCYLALYQQTVVGMLCCSTNQTRCMKIDRADMMQSFGKLRGLLIYLALHREFNQPLLYDSQSVYIENVATALDYRNQGVASTLLNYIFEQLPYQRYLLEVVDTNQKAYQLYQKLGYQEYQRIFEKFPEKMGFNSKIYMKKEKRQENFYVPTA